MLLVYTIAVCASVHSCVAPKQGHANVLRPCLQGKQYYTLHLIPQILWSFCC